MTLINSHMIGAIDRAFAVHFVDLRMLKGLGFLFKIRNVFDCNEIPTFVNFELQ